MWAGAQLADAAREIAAVKGREGSGNATAVQTTAERNEHERIQEHKQEQKKNQSESRAEPKMSANAEHKQQKHEQAQQPSEPRPEHSSLVPSAALAAATSPARKAALAPTERGLRRVASRAHHAHVRTERTRISSLETLLIDLSRSRLAGQIKCSLN